MQNKSALPHKSIPRIPYTSEAEIIESVEADRPIILERGIKDWKILQALERCANDSQRIQHLLKTIGNRVIPYSLLPPDGVIPALPKTPQKQIKQGRFSQFVSEAIGNSAGKHVYYAHGLELSDFPELGPTPTPRIRDWTQQRAGLWVGFGRQVVNLHYDEYLNFICLIAGTKHVTLFPHHVLPNVYPAPLDRVPVSCVLLRRPNFTKFPKFRNALKESHKAVLNPGDVLLIPPFWWHHVESFGFNVMINKFLLVFENRLRDEIQSNLVKGMQIYRHFPQGWRTRYAACYDSIVFRRNALPQSLPLVDMKSVAPAQIREADKHLGESAILFGQLETHLLEKYATTFHYYVFQTYGYPLRHLSKSAYPKMIDRLAAAV